MKHIIFQFASSLTIHTPHYENVPFEVPNNWVWTTLGEIFNLQAGKNITAKDIFTRQDTDHRFPCYGGNGLRGYVSSYNREGHFPLIGRQGALCGNINEANGQFYATEHAIVVDTHCETNIDWAINVLLYLNLNQYATSTAQPGLSVGTINEVMIPVPPLEEQQRISQRINDWFALIDKIEQGKADLQVTIKQAKNKILDLSIHGKLVPQEPNDEPASELLKRINPKAENTCDSGHKWKLPQSWCLIKLKEAFTINPRNKANDDTDAGFVPMTNISDGFSNLFDYELRLWGKIKSGFTHFADDDIAVAKISPCLENRKSVILQNLPNNIGAGTTELHIFRSNYTIPLYGLYFFKSNYFIGECVGTFNGVVGQQRVGKNVVEDILFPLPPFAEQRRIVQKIEELFSALDNIQKALEV
ncbi:restriction endonuclease subunit S [Odoribacter sp. OF09-27XD]|nr:restriction endonuclease subunit S [Odoribacter sp. OF09-27XD]